MTRALSRLIWLTDIHLNFLKPDELLEFVERVRAAAPDAILLGGDTSDSPQLLGFLEQMADSWDRPIYFVLGNHDYYFNSITAVRRAVRALCQRDPRLVWLTDGAIVELGPQTGLIGHDGWADARLGDYERSLVMMNDYKLIAELAAVDKRQRWPLLQDLGDEAARSIRHTLPEALDRYQHVYLLTHVPPFRESCWYEGKISDDEWLPHFTCQAMGDALLAVMMQHPQRKLTVLCGHTHGRGAFRPLENLLVLTGGAVYGQPAIQQMIEVPG